MNALMRLTIFPNVVAQGLGVLAAVTTQNKTLAVTIMLCGYVVGLVIGRMIWPDKKHG